MEIKIKENIGDSIYELKEQVQLEKITCPSCEGEGKLYNKTGTSSIICPDCKGSRIRVIMNIKKWYIDEYMILDHIQIHQGETELIVCYYAMRPMEDFPSDITKDLDKTLFFSREKAEKECEKRNTELGIQKK